MCSFGIDAGATSERAGCLNPFEPSVKLNWEKNDEACTQHGWIGFSCPSDPDNIATNPRLILPYITIQRSLFNTYGCNTTSLRQAEIYLCAKPGTHPSITIHPAARRRLMWWRMLRNQHQLCTPATHQQVWHRVSSNYNTPKCRFSEAGVGDVLDWAPVSPLNWFKNGLLSRSGRP